MNDHYRQHIQSKIGHNTNNKDVNPVKVTYVKNNLTFDDSRFAGKGLIEYFIKADQAFGSMEQQL